MENYIEYESLVTLAIVELAVVIGKDGRDYQPSQAMDHVAGNNEYMVDYLCLGMLGYWDHVAWNLSLGYALAIDMTARNLQVHKALLNQHSWCNLFYSWIE